MNHIVHEGREPWHNYHNTISTPAVDLWGFAGSAETHAATYLAETASEIGDLLKAVHQQGSVLRPTGSQWSFSDILGGADHILRVRTRARIFAVPAEVRRSHHEVPLVLASAGTTVHELNAAMEPDASLHTSGAHDGQTLGGLLGTGTHGSTLRYGAFQNHVRGVHMVTGPGRSVWIERGPQPVLDPEFVRQFATDILLDPVAFEAALVHIGGLGVLNGVLLEVSDGYMVDLVNRKLVLDRDHLAMLEAGDYLDFARKAWPQTESEPYFLQVILNPFRPFAGFRDREPSAALISLMFKRPRMDFFVPQEPEPAEHDPLNLLARGFPKDPPHELLPIGDIAFEFVDRGFDETPAGQEPERKTWGQANGPHRKQTAAGFTIELYNAAYGVPRERLLPALDAMLRGFNENRLAPAVFTLRFVKDAAGLLAFTRFPNTVVVNLDGLREGLGLGGQCEEAAKRVAYALEYDGLEFSQHWGKQGRISRNRFMAGFGDPSDPASKAGQWRHVRERLLSPDMREVITSPALRAWDLA